MEALGYMNVIPSSKTRLLCSVNDYNRVGHGEDLRVSVKNAFTTNIDLTILQDIPKTPEHYVSTILEEVLLSSAVILDDCSSDKNNDAEKLIQFGISYALQRPCVLVHVINNSQALSHIPCSIIFNDFKRAFDSYLELSSELPPNIERLTRSMRWPIRERNSRLVHAFSVFGADSVAEPDLRRVIDKFGHESKWSAIYCDQPNYISSLDNLSRAIQVPPFSIFCLSDNNDNSIFVSIGIAVGMGVPFLILQSQTATLPEILHKYSGIINYTNHLDLAEKLSNHTSAFLSDDVFSWNGSPFFHLLTYLEGRLQKAKSQSEFDTLESTIQAIIKAIRSPLAKPHMLLGDLYRQRHFHINPLDTSVLTKAISHYVDALEIQPNFVGCKDNIVAVERNIQLVELLLQKKYHSISGLIELIGTAISSEYYKFVREFLLLTVRQLAADGEYAHALALLVAITRHDDSEEVKELMQSLLSTAPAAYIEAIQDAQKHIVLLENENSRLALSLAEEQVLTTQLSQSTETQRASLVELNERLRLVQQERDGLTENLERNLGQYMSSLQEQKVLQEKIELSSEMNTGRGVIVNFGFGWAIYQSLQGESSVLRGGYTLLAEEGLVLVNGDRVYDENGEAVWMIPPEYSVIAPRQS